MKFKKAFYCNNGPINPKYTRDDWLRNKDIYYRGTISADFQRDFEIKIKYRHRRSIAIRNLKQLYKCTFIELLSAEMEFDEGAFDSHHGMDCKWVKKHRVYAYHY